MSDSDTDDELRAELLALRKALGSAYRTEEDEEIQDAQAGREGSEPLSAAAEGSLAVLARQCKVVKAALDANLQLQRQLELVKQEIEKDLGDNTSSVTALQQHRAQTGGETGDNRQQEGSIIGPSRFWVQNGQVPEANADTVALLPYYHYLPHRFASQRWTTQACMELQAQVLIGVKNEAFEAASRADAAGALEATVQHINTLTLASPGVEDRIACWTDTTWDLNTENMRDRSGKACRIHWHNHCKPSLNHDAWSEGEESQLRELAAQYGQRRWDEIATDLQTGRTAVACLMQYKAMRHRITGSGKFTAAEEQKIQEAVAAHGHNWGAVAGHVGGGRNRQQVMHHYYNVMKAEAQVPRKLGKWSPEEDALLVQAFAIAGSKKINRWSQMSQMVPGRTSMQCRERWCNVLNPDLKPGTAWTEQELQTLQEAVQQHSKEDGSIGWAAVAARLPGRTDKDVKRQHTNVLAREHGDTVHNIRKQLSARPRSSAARSSSAAGGS